MKKKSLTLLLFLVLTFYSSFSYSQFSLWGMTQYGGSSNRGVIFTYDPSTSTFTKKLDFNGTTIRSTEPWGSLLLASDGNLYGMSSQGGGIQTGDLFEYNLLSETYTWLTSYMGDGGERPYGSLIQANNGKLYGMTSQSPLSIDVDGVMFEYDYITDTCPNIIYFDRCTIGGGPNGDLLQASNGKLYGMTSYGNTTYGTMFEYKISSNNFTNLLVFNGTNGAGPLGSLIQASNGKLYGLTQYGGAYDYGVLFEYDTLSGILTKKVDFDSITTGSHPCGSLMQASNGKLYGVTSSGGTHNFGVLFEYNIANDTLINKFNFDNINGRNSHGTLMEASDGNLYGMTWEGGIHDMGVIFGYDTMTGTLTKKFDFDSIHGSYPHYTKLIEVPDTLVKVSKYTAKDININIYPNPNNGSAKIDYTLPPGVNEGEIVFYNLQGMEVKRFKVDRTFNTLLISTKDIAAGTYYYQLQTSGESSGGKKMVVIK
jgi:uncharacterized repeat protein (TIGR03803 family)